MKSSSALIHPESMSVFYPPYSKRIRRVFIALLASMALLLSGLIIAVPASAGTFSSEEPASGGVSSALAALQEKVTNHSRLHPFAAVSDVRGLVGEGSGYVLISSDPGAENLVAGDFHCIVPERGEKEYACFEVSSEGVLEPVSASPDAVIPTMDLRTAGLLMVLLIIFPLFIVLRGKGTYWDKGTMKR